MLWLGDETDDAQIGRCADQAQFDKHVRIPPIARRRLTDHDDAAGPDAVPGGAERELRRAEPAGDDRISADEPRPNRIVGLGRHHDHAVTEVEPTDHLSQKVGAFGPPVEQRDAQIGPVERDDEARDAAACAEIDDGSDDPVEGSDECPGMVDDFNDGSAPQQAEALGSTPRLVQFFVEPAAGSVVTHDVEYVR